MPGQRIKKRIEALEMVQQGQITNNPSMPQPLRDTTSPKLNNSHVMNRQYPLSAASSTNPTPSLVSAFTRDESYPSPFEGHHNPYSAISTSSTDTFPTFKPPDGPSSHGVWNLSQAINAGLDLQDLARPGDVEYDDMPEWSCPELEKEVGAINPLAIVPQRSATSPLSFRPLLKKFLGPADTFLFLPRPHKSRVHRPRDVKAAEPRCT